MGGNENPPAAYSNEFVFASLDEELGGEEEIISKNIKKDHHPTKSLHTIDQELLTCELSTVEEFENELRKNAESDDKTPPPKNNPIEEIKTLLLDGQVKPMYLSQATLYCDNTELLHNLLNQPEIERACKILGITPAHVLPQDATSFVDHTRDLDLAQMRFDAFNERRRNSIGLLLQARAPALRSISSDVLSRNTAASVLQSKVTNVVSKVKSKESKRKANILKLKKVKETQKRLLQLKQNRIKAEIEEKTKLSTLKQAKLAKEHTERTERSLIASKTKSDRILQNFKNACDERAEKALKKKLYLEKQIATRERNLVLKTEELKLKRLEKQEKVDRIKASREYFKTIETSKLQERQSMKNTLDDLSTYCNVVRTSGVFDLNNPKSDIEWQIYRASMLPGPGEYDPKFRPMSGGTFPKNIVPSDVEVQMKRAADLPGPGSYETLPSSKTASVVKFSTNDNDGLIDSITRANTNPGPGTYTLTEPKSPVKLKQTFESLF